MSDKKENDECSVEPHGSPDGGDSTDRPVFALRCRKVVSVDLELESTNGTGRSVLQFQEVTILSYEMLTRAELESMGLLAQGGWYPVTEEDMYGWYLAERTSVSGIDKFVAQRP